MLLTLRRAFGIGWAVWGYLGWLALRRYGLIRPAQHPGERLAHTLESLGTTFVKAGQVLVLRRDLLPEEYVLALQRLQDRVAVFPTAVARAEVERALGTPIGELFEEFHDTPLAAASIAQVHVARLLSGRAVIVKVRRPRVVATIARDMFLLRLALRVTMILAPRVRRLDPLAIVGEIELNLRRETDFRLEARNGMLFRRAFRGWPQIMVPEVFEALSTESVMVQELSGGHRVEEIGSSADARKFAEVLVDAYLHQFFVLGAFHADPHGGNLFHTQTGRLCLHDFGMVGYLHRGTRRNLAALMQAFVNQDAEWMLDASLALGILGGQLERSVFRAGLEQILRDFAHLPLSQWSFAEALLRISALGRGHNLRIPHELLLLMRAVLLLEHAVRTLDPECDLVNGLLGKAPAALKASLSADRHPLSRLQHEALETATDLPALAARVLRQVRSDGIGINVRVDRMRTLEEELRRSSDKMSVALVTLGLYIASSLLMQHSLGPQLWGVPVLALIGYALALRFTYRLVRRFPDR